MEDLEDLMDIEEEKKVEGKVEEEENDRVPDNISTELDRLTEVRALQRRNFDEGKVGEIFRQLSLDHDSVLASSSRTPDQLCITRNTIMDSKGIKLSEDLWSYKLQRADGKLPFILRPAIDHYKFFRSTTNSSVPIQGVVGDGIKQFEGKPGWVLCDVSIHLSDTTVPNEIINHLNLVPSLSEGLHNPEETLPIEQAIVPLMFAFDSCDKVIQLVQLFETETIHTIGDREVRYKPAYQWKTKHKDIKWCKEMMDNYGNFLKDYIFVHLKKDKLALNSKVTRKTAWRSFVKATYASDPRIKDKMFYYNKAIELKDSCALLSILPTESGYTLCNSDFQIDNYS